MKTKIIPEYSNYEATTDGRVRTNRLRKGWLTPTVDRNGYVRYHLIDDNGKRKGMYIHQIVALTYLPNPEGKKFVNHKDHNKANNSIENLEWCTHLENIRHDWAMGRRKPINGEALNLNKTTEATAKEIRNLYGSGVLQKELAEMFGISQPTVSQIVRNVTWRNVT